jgi:hypothetical protein
MGVGEMLSSFWADLVGRTTGPMTFRLVLQPAMALLYATLDGVKDARTGRPAYFWAALLDPDERTRLLQEGWARVRRVLILAAVMDAVYQLIVVRHIYLVQLVVVVLVLAFVPYLLWRGPVNRIARAFLRRADRRPLP